MDVKVCPHEYSKKEGKRVSIYRVDFCATIREGDGSEHLVLIELQKTWRPTELLRFRKYLDMQYEDKRNVNDETGAPLPIVCIYLLGHTIGDLTEPVVYVKRQYLDYDSREIQDGVPCTFVESLTHDSIIVQIPFLKGNVRNHLERILEIFYQDFVSEASDRLIYIEGRDFSDPDAQRLITRLAFAAADPEIHYAMNVEEEILGEHQDLETELMILQEKLAGKSCVEIDEKLLSKRRLQREETKRVLQATARVYKQSGLSAEKISRLVNLTKEEIADL